MLAPSERAIKAADDLLTSCAGLLLTGGGDVSPVLYGGPPLPGRDHVDPVRDAFELALLSTAANRGLPVLAICHGMQLLNVARGGSLRQRLAPAVAGRHGTPDAWTQHAVSLRRNSRLAMAVGAGELSACSSHHQQAIASLGVELAEAGWSEDGVVEAIEGTGSRWIVGVQWHPEDTAASDAQQRRIFGAFVEASRTGDEGS